MSRAEVPPKVELLTVREVAVLTRVSTMTVYRLIKRGELPAVRVGRSYRIRRQDLIRYLVSSSTTEERS